MKVGYVISMKTGMSSFNRDELLELEGYGIPFVIYVTKFRKGPYMPEDRWSVRLPGIALDIDNPADLARFLPLGAHTCTGRLLAENAAALSQV